MTRPALCIHCHVQLKEPIVELHEECTARLERLWHIIKPLADKGQKAFDWDAGDIYDDVAHVLYAPWTGRVFRVTIGPDGSLQNEDCTDNYSMLQKSLAEVQQANQALQSRVQELETKLSTEDESETGT